MGYVPPDFGELWNGPPESGLEQYRRHLYSARRRDWMPLLNGAALVVTAVLVMALAILAGARP